MKFPHGSLVRAREREWVVLPESTDETLILRPIDGTDAQIAGVYLPLEQVEEASFPLPRPEQAKDTFHCSLLRDAVRLGTRHGAGPFRCLSRIPVEPRPYQMVPLLMALKLNPVRMLIADDVGIGKTIESGLIARELLDRGEIKRFTVLCPPAIAEQWQQELNCHFDIEAELVLPGTAARLERRCAQGQSLFEIYPFTVVSLDYIKSERHRFDFIRACPEFVIVDEAHTCTVGFQQGANRHQRYELISKLSKTADRHLVLVTATPHSGKDDNFASLLGLLDPKLAQIPPDLSGPDNEPTRKMIARHLVQRRRGDIRKYLDQETLFPAREEGQDTYNFSPEYEAFFEKVLNFAIPALDYSAGSVYAQRLMRWSALALLRSVVSSPAAAIATLRNRSLGTEGEQSVQALDEAASATILDLGPDETAELPDNPAGADTEETGTGVFQRDVLLRLARDAEKLKGKLDDKLNGAEAIAKQLLKDGFNPIIFCRFIQTAEYVADELRKRLKASHPDLVVSCITGLIPPEARKQQIEDLDESRPQLLVCTECLSEGINLQFYFDAVLHYDLSWNPTRHEQREGRVDRFGQPKKTVRVVTYAGNNPMDGAVIEILLAKHQKIRRATGVSVPVPVETELVVQAIRKSLRLRQGRQLGLFDSPTTDSAVDDLHLKWQNAADREKKSRSLYAQHAIKIDEVAEEIRLSRAALGTQEEVRNFFESAMSLHKAHVLSRNGTVRISLRDVAQSLLDAVGLERKDSVLFRFEPPSTKNARYIHRTSPILRELSAYIVNSSLGEGIAGRIGAIRTAAVGTRTTLLLYRLRFELALSRGDERHATLVEDTAVLGFRGSPSSAEWLTEKDALALTEARPSANMLPEQVRDTVKSIADRLDGLKDYIDKFACERAKHIEGSHQRVRKAAQMYGVSYTVTPHQPDLMGLYVFLPGGGAA